MILIKHTGGDTTAHVTAIMYNPDPEQVDPSDVWIDTAVPHPENFADMVPALMIKLDDNTLYYNYTKPKSLETMVGELNQQQAVMKAAMDDLIMGGGV